MEDIPELMSSNVIQPHLKNLSLTLAINELMNAFTSALWHKLCSKLEIKELTKMTTSALIFTFTFYSF